MSTIIDCHMHVIPVWCGARNGIIPIKGERYGKVRFEGKGIERIMPPSFTNMTVWPEMVLEYMEWTGVDKAVLLQAPLYGVHNEYVSEVLTNHKDKFIAGFGLLDPRDEDASEKVSHLIKNMGFRGIKFEVPDVPFWLNDEEYFPIWERIQKEEGILALDLGWNKDDNPYCFQIKQLRELLKHFPQITVVVLHLGVSRLWDQSQKYPFSYLQETLALNEFPNVWFELSGVPLLCEAEEYPYPRAQEIIKVVWEAVGADRILWGTDFPTVLEACTYHQALNLVKRNCDFLSTEDKNKILGENAMRLYRLQK